MSPAEIFSFRGLLIDRPPGETWGRRRGPHRQGRHGPPPARYRAVVGERVSHGPGRPRPPRAPPRVPSWRTIRTASAVVGASAVRWRDGVSGARRALCRSVSRAVPSWTRMAMALCAEVTETKDYQPCGVESRDGVALDDRVASVRQRRRPHPDTREIRARLLHLLVAHPHVALGRPAVHDRVGDRLEPSTRFLSRVSRRVRRSHVRAAIAGCRRAAQEGYAMRYA